MATKKKKTLPVPKKSAAQRIAAGVYGLEKIGLPKDAVMFTLLTIEIQVLENRVNELEEKLVSFKK